MKKLKQGILITVEGIDGCGKTTFIKELAKHLKKDVLLTLTKESGGSELGKHLHQLVQTQPVSITPKAEYLLFAADRAQHIAEVVQPAIEKKHLVISDRMGDSSVVYQGFARGLDIDMIDAINTWTMNAIKPLCTFYLQIDPAIAIQRFHNRKEEIKEELTVFEKEKKNFMHRVADGYDKWFKNKEHVITLDATQPTKIIADEAYNMLMQWITKNSLYE